LEALRTYLTLWPLRARDPLGARGASEALYALGTLWASLTSWAGRAAKLISVVLRELIDEVRSKELIRSEIRGDQGAVGLKPRLTLWSLWPLWTLWTLWP
jgi:hypothetical protein